MASIRTLGRGEPRTGQEKAPAEGTLPSSDGPEEPSTAPAASALAGPGSRAPETCHGSAYPRDSWKPPGIPLCGDDGRLRDEIRIRLSHRDQRAGDQLAEHITIARDAILRVLQSDWQPDEIDKAAYWAAEEVLRAFSTEENRRERLPSTVPADGVRDFLWARALLAEHGVERKDTRGALAVLRRNGIHRSERWLREMKDLLFKRTRLT